MLKHLEGTNHVVPAGLFGAVFLDRFLYYLPAKQSRLVCGARIQLKTRVSAIRNGGCERADSAAHIENRLAFADPTRRDIILGFCLHVVVSAHANSKGIVEGLRSRGRRMKESEIALTATPIIKVMGARELVHGRVSINPSVGLRQLKRWDLLQ